MRLQKITTAVIDLCESVAIFVVTALLSPLLITRIPLGNGLLAAKILVPSSLYATYLRASISIRWGDRGNGVTTLTQIAKVLEDGVTADSELEKKSEKALLAVVLGQVFRGNLRLGRIEAAADTLIKANKLLELDHFPQHPDFTVPFAHVLRVSAVAGRLLDDATIRELFESGQPIIIRNSTSDEPEQNPRGKPTARQPKRSPNLGAGAKIIPFKRPDNTVHP